MKRYQTVNAKKDVKKDVKKDIKKEKNKEKKIKKPRQISDLVIKILLIVLLVIFTIIIYIIVKKVIITNESIGLSENRYYIFCDGFKYDIEKGFSISKDKTSDAYKLITNDEKTIYLDSNPIYCKDQLKCVIFPEEMAVVSNVGEFSKIPKFTQISNENFIDYAQKNQKNDKDAILNSFLFDGEDLYFFLEDMEVTIGDQIYQLSAYSYAIVNYRNYIELYNYETNEIIVIDDEIEVLNDVIAKSVNHNYTINMSTDSINTTKAQMLLLKNISDFKEIGDNKSKKSKK